MSTSGRGSLRRPFDSINANTLSSLPVGAGRSSEHSNPVKKDKSKGLLSGSGILSSILPSNKKKGSRPPSSEPSSPESPTKKSRVDNVTSSRQTAGEAVLPRAHTENMKTESKIEAGAVVFREDSSVNDIDMDDFWDVEMEELLTLKVANPILDESREDDDSDEGRVAASEERSGPEAAMSNQTHETVKDSLMKDLDENTPGDPLLWADRVPEHETEGFQLPLDQ